MSDALFEGLPQLNQERADKAVASVVGRVAARGVEKRELLASTADQFNVLAGLPAQIVATLRRDYPDRIPGGGMGDEGLIACKRSA